MTLKPETYMRKAAQASLWCNIVLVSIKLVAFFLVNSLAIAVDLGISFVGLTVSVILYYSIKLANRPADLIHNYGYGKVEHVCEAMEGVVLIGIAFAMSFQAFSAILHPKTVSLPWVGFSACAINVVLNFGGAYYIFMMAKKSASPAIHAEGIHFRMEGFISTMIAFSFILSMYLQAKGRGAIAAYIDPLAALSVSLILIIPSFKLAKKSFFKLLDASVEEDSQIEILKQLTAHIDKFCEFRDLRTRTAGRHKFIEFKLIVPEDITFRKGHEIVKLIEVDIKEHIPNCEVLIRLEPCQKDCTFIKNNEPCQYL